MPAAILATITPDSTLHSHALEWCDTFTDDYRLLTADGLNTPNVDPAPPTETVLADLAQTVDLNARDLEWIGTIYVLASPDLLDATTGDQFRRTLRVVFDRLPNNVRYPYDDLDDTRDRAGWLAACLDTGDIVNPAGNYTTPNGIEPGQSDLGSFL